MRAAALGTLTAAPVLAAALVYDLGAAALAAAAAAAGVISGSYLRRAS